MRINELFDKDTAKAAGKGILQAVAKHAGIRMDSDEDEVEPAKKQKSEFDLDKLKSQLSKIVDGETISDTSVFKRAIDVNWKFLNTNEYLRSAFNTIVAKGKLEDPRELANSKYLLKVI